MSKEPTVKSFSATDAHGVAVRFTVSTDIVDYMASARAFGREDLAAAGAHGRFQKRLIAIPDRKTEIVAPMLLSIGNNNSLYLVRKHEGTAGEAWKLTDLTAAFEKFGVIGAKVQALGAAWTDDDRIAVSVALESGEANAPSRVFVAYNLSSQTDWEKIPWVDCGTRNTTRVYGIRVLAEADGNWTVVLDADAGQVDNLFLIRSKRPASFAQALVFNPAVDFQEILDFDVAVDDVSGSGIAVLGHSGNKRVLAFRPFPDYDAGGTPTLPPVMPLPCPEGATAIQSGVTRNGATDIYIGGQGVYLLAADQFDNQLDGKLIAVAAADAARNVEEIVVADAADGGVALWARKQNGDLVVVTHAAGAAAERWSTPLRVREGVQAIGAVQGGRLVTTSVLAVYTDGRASFLLRDAATGAWREGPLMVGDPDQAAKITCYGATVRVLDDGGLPRVDLPVKVSASALTNVSLNAHNVFIGPGLEISAKTDRNGAVMIYDRVRSLTPSVYRLTFEGISGSVDVNPAGGIYERFSKMTAAELRSATVSTPGGGEAPLLPAEFREGGSRSGEVDGMVGALTQTAKLAGQTANGTVLGANQVRAGATFSDRLRTDTVPAGYQWGIHAGAGGVRLVDADVMNALAGAAQSVTQFFSDLGDSLADLFEGIRARIAEGWTFVVRKAEQAFEFICAVGNKIKKFVLQTLEQIGSFFTWLWNEVKTGVEKLWEFLKFVFNWEDILMARDVLVSVAGEALTYMKASTKTLREKTVEGFDGAIAQVNRWRTDIGLPPAHLKPPPPGDSVSDSYREAGPEARDKVDQSTGNSAIGWVFERIDSLFDQFIHIEGVSPGEVATNALAKFVKGIATDQLDNLLNTWEQIQRDIQGLFDSKMPGVKELSFETIKTMLVALGSDVVIGFLTALRDLAARAIDLLGDMIEVMRAALFAKISFPFIEKLVELVSPGTKVDTSFRVVDGLMLLAAVPATITYKLIFGQAPFKKGDSMDFPFGRVTVQDLTLDEMKKIAIGIVPFVGIGVAFIKTIVGVYFSVKAVAGEFAGSNKGIVIGLIFGNIGLIAQAVSVRWKEGSAVTALEWACYGASALSFLTSLGVSGQKWNNHGLDVIPGHEKLEAVMDIFTTGAQLVMCAVVFGLIADSVVRSTTAYNRHRILPETFSWVATLLDQSGGIMTSAAALVPVAAAPVKAFLIGGGAIGKGAATGFKILEVTAMKVVLEKFAPA